LAARCVSAAPADFDERFHQVAPEDQQMPYPTGGETVHLMHLLPDRPALAFALPRLDMQVRVLRADYRQEAPVAVVDTLFFEPDQRRFSVVWRASVRQQRGIQEFREVAVGPIDPVWWRQRVAGGCAGCSGDAPGVGVGVGVGVGAGAGAGAGVGAGVGAGAGAGVGAGAGAGVGGQPAGEAHA
jgi:hypothetical protein